MKWIYLSPHLDDAALSCGGLAWQQAAAGDEVLVWTFCAGDPPPGAFSPFALSLHERWQTGPQAAAQRRKEDMASAAALGAGYRHMSLPDCIYRSGPDGSALYPSEAAIFGEIHPSEAGLVARLADEIAAAWEADGNMVCPLGLGGHVDHRLVHAAAARSGVRLLYYADYPYVLINQAVLAGLETAGWQPVDLPISAPACQAWVNGVAAHSSQISSFWADLADMEAAIRAYAGQPPVIRLWQAPQG